MAADKNSKVQIDIVANSQELSPDLQQAEKNINTFGQKITGIFDKISASTSSIKDSVTGAFTSGVRSIQKFDETLKISQTLSTAYNQIWAKSRLFLNVYTQQLNYTIATHKEFNRVNILTGASAGYTTTKLIDYAKHLSLITTYSQEATESAMRMIMQFRNIHGKEFLGATKAAQNLATELKMDLNSAANLVGQALNNPIAAMQQLAQVNIYFTATERKAIEQLIKNNKVVEAQTRILNKLELAYGGAAKAAGETFVGRMERLKNVLTQIGTTIGQKVLDSLNNIFGSGEKGKQVFDSFLKKVEEWGKVAIAAVDVLVPKIVEFTRSLQFNFDSVYTWLLDQTINIFSGIQAVYQNAGKILHSVNLFIFSSFSKIWGGISLIFTDIIPKAYHYMKDVFVNLSQQIWQNLQLTVFNIKVLWQRAKNDAEQLLNTIYWEFVKFGIKLAKWGLQIVTTVVGWWKSLIPGLSVVINKFYDWVEDKADEWVDEYTETQNKLTNQAKAAYAVYSDFENPFGNVDVPDFGTPISQIGQALNLTDEWGNAINNLNENIGEDFRNNLEENTKEFNQFVDNVKKKSKETNDLFKEPKMEANKRREDEKNKVESSFKSGFTGLEDLWRSMSSGGSPEVKATQENTKATAEQTKELKKKTLAERKAEYEKQQGLKRAANMEEMEKRRKGKIPETTEERIKRTTEAAKKREHVQELRNKEATERLAKKLEKEKGLSPEHALAQAILQRKQAKFESLNNRKEPISTTNREELHAKSEAKRLQRKEFSDAIKARMAATGETYAKARINLERAGANRNAPAQEFAKQRQDTNEAKRTAVKQHEDQNKHLQNISHNTRNSVNEMKETKKQTAQIAKNTRDRNIV